MMDGKCKTRNKRDVGWTDKMVYGKQTDAVEAMRDQGI